MSPAGLNNVIAIDAGHGRTVALRQGGTVVAWGRNIYGESSVPSTLRDVTTVSAGGYHTDALRENGSIEN